MSAPSQLELDGLVEQAEALFARDEVEPAVQLLSQVVAANPGHVRALNDLGTLCYSRGALDYAAQFFTRALTLDPANLVCRTSLVTLLLEQSHLEPARELLASGAKLHPGNSTLAGLERDLQLAAEGKTGTLPMPGGIDPSLVSCCLITKETIYPSQILADLSQIPFGELLVLTHSDSPFRKHELFRKAKFGFVYYQDDDAICPARELLRQADPGRITLALKEGHFLGHRNDRATMGLGWGTVFHKDLLNILHLYTDLFGEDDVYRRETERIFTYLCSPQKRLVLPIQDLPSAFAADRLWRQPEHNQFRDVAHARCQAIVAAQGLDCEQARCA